MHFPTLICTNSPSPRGLRPQICSIAGSPIAPSQFGTLANGTLLALVEGNLVELVVNSSGAYTATTIDTNVQSFTISSNGLSFTDKHPTSSGACLLK